MYMKTTRSATWAAALAAARAARTAARRRRRPPRRGRGSGRAGSTRTPARSAGGSPGWISRPQARLDLDLDLDLLQPFLSFLFFPLQDSERRLKNPTQETIGTDTTRRNGWDQSRTLIARTSHAGVDASGRNDVQAWAPDRLTDGEVRTPRQELVTVPTSRELGLVWKMPGECRKDRCFHGCIQCGEDKDLATTFSTTDGL